MTYLGGKDHETLRMRPIKKESESTFIFDDTSNYTLYRFTLNNNVLTCVDSISNSNIEIEFKVIDNNILSIYNWDE